MITSDSGGKLTFLGAAAFLAGAAFLATAFLAWKGKKQIGVRYLFKNDSLKMISVDLAGFLAVAHGRCPSTPHIACMNFPNIYRPLVERRASCRLHVPISIGVTTFRKEQPRDSSSLPHHNLMEHKYLEFSERTRASRLPHCENLD